jgi:Homeodomain-like domain
MQPTTISAGRARRGQIILLHADRHPISAIATTVGISRRFVYKWGAAVSGAGPRGIGRPAWPWLSVCVAPLLWRSSTIGVRDVPGPLPESMVEGNKFRVQLHSTAR